ncbi:MAG: TldD/PmbA family protein [Candidatus Bathyarchaeota archaeon]|nr:MAG: TldD/PmbA family protein [Candidatus Bathyarchaeota archaeon]
MFDLLEHAVTTGEKLGARLAEARLDDFHIREIRTEMEEVRDVKSIRRVGIGVNVYYKGATGYSFETKPTKNAVEIAAEKAFKIAKASSKAAEVKVDPGETSSYEQKDLSLDLKKHPKAVSLSLKKDMVLRAVSAAKEYGTNISSIVGLYGELSGKKLFMNSERTEVSWSPLLVDLRLTVVSKQGDLLVDGSDGMGGSFGLELFDSDQYSPERLGENAAKWAAEKLKAKPAPPGKHRALCENRLVGVLAHESFGHLTESDFVVTGMSPLAGKIGQQLGSEHATIIDEGAIDTHQYHGFWLPIDDQGTKTSRTIVMDRGKLLNYLHMRDTAVAMKAGFTGNARAVNYTFPPIVRMKNTYFSPGDLSLEEALEQLGTGIYAIRTRGGQANMDGTFMFKARRGYYIKNGEKKYPLREVTLTGSILDFLNNIEGATKERPLFSSYFGGCGKSGQYPLPCGLGGPHLLVREVRFGGEK